MAQLATVRGDGRPHLVPIVFALVGETIVTAIDQKPKTTDRLMRLTNIESNPVVSVLVHNYEDDWNLLWWVRVDGEARVLTHGPEFTAGIAALFAKYPQYREAPPPGPVIVVSIDSVTEWSARA